MQKSDDGRLAGITNHSAPSVVHAMVPGTFACFAETEWRRPGRIAITLVVSKQRTSIAGPESRS